MLVHPDPRRECGAAQRPHEARRVHGRAVAEEDAAAEGGGDARRVARNRLVGAADLARRGELLLELRVLARRRRHLQHAALAQPGVLAARLEERADAGDDRVAGGTEAERGLVAEELP